MNKKISRIKTEFLEFRFKVKLEGNGNYHNLGIGGQIINKIENCKTFLIKVPFRKKIVLLFLDFRSGTNFMEFFMPKFRFKTN